MFRRTSNLILEIFLAVLVSLVVITAVAAWRLSQGPVSLAFLTPYIEQALGELEGPLTFTLEDTILTWAGWERTLDIRAVRVNVLDETGVVVARVPELSISLSARGFLRGIVAPTRLDIIGPRVRLVRDHEGAFQFGLDQGGASTFLPRIVDGLLAPPDPDSSLGYLSSLSIIAADITIEDQRLGVLWRAPRGNVTFARSRDGIRADAELTLELNGSRVRVEGVADHFASSGKTDVDVAFSDFSPASFASVFPDLAPLERFRVPLSGRFTSAMDARGIMGAVDFRIAGGAGRLEDPALWPEPLAVRSVAAEGRIDEDRRRFTVKRFFVDFGGPTVSGDIRITRLADHVSIDANVEGREIPAARASRIWPLGVGKAARHWITGHLSDGTIHEIDANISARTELAHPERITLRSITGTLRADGFTVNYLDGLPSALGVSATAVLDHERFDLTLRGGYHKGIRIRHGDVAITGLDEKNLEIVIDLRLSGTLGDALELLDHEPLGYASKFGLDPSSVGGEADARVSFGFPLLRTITVDELRVGATARLKGFSIPQTGLGRPLRNGVATFQLAGQNMELVGQGDLGSLPIGFAWKVDFTPGAPFRDHYKLRAVLKERDRKDFGFDLSRYVKGSLPVEVDFRNSGETTGELTLNVDLKNAILEIPLFGWVKPLGMDGTGRISFALEKGRITNIRNFDLKTEDFLARGSARIAPDGKSLAAAEIDRLAFAANDFKATVLARGGGGYDIDIAGPGLDVAPLMRDAELEPSEDLPPITVSARIGRLWFGAGPPLAKVVGAVRYDGENWRNIVLEGTVGEAETVSLKILTAGPRRVFSVRSTDAGELLKSLDIVDNVAGGSIEVTATDDVKKPGTPWVGKIVIRDFQLSNAPFLARLLSLASLTGIENAIAGKGVKFARLEIPFTYDAGRMTIDQANAFGSELGVTANGKIDLRKKTIDLDGTLIPAYTLNTILGKVPIVGSLLTGGKGSGVFAATFDVAGPFREPRMRVNLLAALAPGFTRNILRIFRGGTKGIPPEPQPD